MARRPIRVLYIITSLGVGGAERSLAELIPHLAREGVDATALCLVARDEGVEDHVRANGIAVRHLRSRRLMTRIAEARRVLVAIRPDIVHTAIFDADIVGRLAAAGTRSIVVSTLANTSYDPIRLCDPNVSRMGFLATRAIDSWTARRLTTHFHAVSHAVKEAAIHSLRIPPDRITVIERGREPERLGVASADRRRMVRQRLDIPDDAEVLVNVGRQEFQKGQRWLLDTVALLLPSRPRLLCLIAGQRGSSTTALRAQATALGIGAAIRWLGHRDDVPDLLAAADLFVFPSLYEGFGGAAVEALALGVPIAAFDLAPLREVLEDGANALLVPRQRADLLAGAIAELLDDPARRQAFGESGRRRFVERFTIEPSARRTAALYRRLLDSSPDHDGQGGGHAAPPRARS